MATWGPYFSSRTELKDFNPSELPDGVAVYLEGEGWAVWYPNSLELETSNPHVVRPNILGTGDPGRFKVVFPELANVFNLATVTYVDTQTQLGNLSNELVALDGLSSTGLIERTGDGTMQTVPISTLSSNFLNLATQADWRSNLGLGSAATQAETYFLKSSEVSTFGGSLVDDNDSAEARTTLQLGSAATEDSTAFAAAGHDHVASFPNGFLYKDSSDALVAGTPTQHIAAYPGTAPTALETETKTTSIFTTNDPTTMGGTSATDFAGSYIFTPASDGSAWIMASGYSKDTRDPDYTPYQDGIIHVNVSNGTIFASNGGSWLQVGQEPGAARIATYQNSFPENVWGVDITYGTTTTPTGTVPEDGEVAICVFDNPSNLGGGSSTTDGFRAELFLWADGGYWHIMHGKSVDSQWGPPDIYTPPEANITHYKQDTSDVFLSQRVDATTTQWAQYSLTVI